MTVNLGGNTDKVIERKIMKARFYVTVEVPTPKSQVEKVKIKDAKAEVTSLLEEKVNEYFADMNPTGFRVRFPRK